MVHCSHFSAVRPVLTELYHRHPTGGSFIRPQKASFGVTYLAAMRQRYEVDLDAITGEQLKISTRTVEMIGFEAVSEKQK